MPIVTVTPKGQVMIPASLRKRFGIKPGRKVSVEVEGDRLVVRPLPEDPVDALYGILSRAPEAPAVTETAAPPARGRAKRANHRLATRSEENEGD